MLQKLPYHKPFQLLRAGCAQLPIYPAVHENTEMMFYIDDLQEDHKELEANFSELEQVHKLWGEEIDRLRRTIVELQTNRFTADEFIGMIMKNFMPSADK